MIAIFIPFILLYLLLAIPALYKSHIKKQLFLIDMIQPFFLVVIWVGITMLGVGNQSLANIIEVPIILIVSLIVLYMKMYIKVNKLMNYNLHFIMIFL